MAVSALSALTQNTITITEKRHDELVRQSEQLRILKNFIRLEQTYSTEYENLIKAMEANNE